MHYTRRTLLYARKATFCALCAELWGEFSVRNLPAPQGEGMGVGSVIFHTSTILSSFRALSY